jgi:hypothetical protein
MAAVMLFLYSRIDGFANLRKYCYYYLILLIALTASDFYFAFYFGVLILASINKNNWRKILLIGAIFCLLSISIFMFSWFLNPSLKNQVLHSLFPPEFNKIQSLLALLGIMTLPTLSYFYLIYKGEYSEESRPLYLALVLGGFLLWIGGQLKNENCFRYFAFVLPISIILLSQALLGIPTKVRYFLILVCSVLAISLAYTNLISLGHIRTPIYKDEISCLNNQEIKHSTIVAEYWAAKPIFEATNRQYNLWQTNRDLGRFSWINNKSWERLYEDNGITYLIKSGLNTASLNNIDPNLQADLICNGTILAIKSSPQLVLRGF